MKIGALIGTWIAFVPLLFSVDLRNFGVLRISKPIFA